MPGAASPALVGTDAFVKAGVAVFLIRSFVGETVKATTLIGRGIILSAVALIVLFPAKPVSLVPVSSHASRAD